MGSKRRSDSKLRTRPGPWARIQTHAQMQHDVLMADAHFGHFRVNLHLFGAECVFKSLSRTFFHWVLSFAGSFSLGPWTSRSTSMVYVWGSSSSSKVNLKVPGEMSESVSEIIFSQSTEVIAEEVGLDVQDLCMWHVCVCVCSVHCCSLACGPLGRQIKPLDIFRDR